MPGGRELPKPSFDTYPGQSAGGVVRFTQGESGTLPVAVSPDDAKVTWLRPRPPEETITPTTGTEYEPDNEGDSLKIPKVDKSRDGGAWVVRATKDGETAQKSFTVEVTEEQEDEVLPKEPPGEWSDDWGYWALVAGAFVLLAFGAAGWFVLWRNDELASTVPEAVTLLLLALSAVALAGAVTAVLIEVRGRMRAREIVQMHAQQRGFAWPTKAEAEAAAELVKSYGLLKEAAMLGLTAIVLAGFAAVLVGTVLDDDDQQSPRSVATITLTSTKAGCSATTTKAGSLESGKYVVKFNDQSKIRGIVISGASLVARSTVKQRGRTSITAELAKGTYTITCKPKGPNPTPITIGD